MKQSRNTFKKLLPLMAVMAFLTGSPTKAFADEAYALYCSGNTTLYFGAAETVPASGDTYDGQTVTWVWTGEDVTSASYPGWLSYNQYLTTVVFESSFSTVRPTTTYEWFYNCQRLKTITGFDNLNTSSVTSMSEMFSGCTQLTQLTFGQNFDTSNVEDMSGMFASCRIKNLDLSVFNTSKVTNMRNMFKTCSLAVLA